MINRGSLIAILLLLLPYIHTEAQDNNVTDSLKVLIKNTSSDSNKIELFWKLAAEYTLLHPASANKIYLEALSLAKKKFKPAIPRAMLKIGGFSAQLNAKGPTARIYADSALFIATANKDTSSITLSLHQLGVMSRTEGNYSEALDFYYKANNLATLSGDFNQLLLNYHDLGDIMVIQKKYPLAIEYYTAALDFALKINHKPWAADITGHFGEIYRATKDYPESLKYYFDALNQFRNIKKTEMGDVIWRDTSAFIKCLNDIGDVYYLSGEADAALRYLNEALVLAISDIDKPDIAFNLNIQGHVYFSRGDYKTALTCYKKANHILKNKELSDELKKNYEGLAKTYSRLGNYRAAYEYEVLFKQTEDSLAKTDKLHKLSESQMQYDFDKKQSEQSITQAKKDAMQASELINQKQQKKFYIVGGTILLLVVVGLVNRLQYSRRTKKQLEQKNIQIEKEKLRAEQSEKFKQQFLANMSHEIRTPMNAVMGMTNLLIDKSPRSDQFNYLDGIKKSSDTLLYIINDILDLSKIEAGKIELEQIDFSIREVVEQVMQTLHHKAEEKGLLLIMDVDNKVPDVVIGDPVRLNQVLMNLTGNAIKFTERGSVLIEVERSENSEAIGFSIIDTGIGIQKDKLQSVFESFSQVHSSDARKFGGTGLGLTICKQLVELMGGEISIESEEGSGTIFSFEINYLVGSAEGLTEQKHSEQIDGNILNGLKILLVDDNEYNRIVAHDTLVAKAEVEITEATNGKEALELLSKKEFDVILMDVQMPIMDGYEATQQIRRKFTSAKNQIPVIALTASVIRSDLDKCREAGMNDFVPKPFKSSELISAIAKAAGREIRFTERKNTKVNYETGNNPTVTNLSYLEKFCEEDKVCVQKYIDLFLLSAPTLTKKLNAAISENNFEKIASQIHGFSTKFIMIGMDNSKELAMKIELQCRKASPDHTAIKANTLKLITFVEEAIIELKQRKQ